MTTVLVTRPQPDAARVSALLQSRGLDALTDELFTTEFLASHPDKDNYQALLATSRNAIRALARTGLARNYLNIPLFAVGEGTDEEARDLGFFSAYSADRQSLSLAELVIKDCAPDGGPLLYLAGQKRKSWLEDILPARGFTLRIWEGYAMRPSPALKEGTQAALRQKTIDAILLFSEQASLHFLKLAEPLDDALMAPTYICLSEQVAMPLRQKGLTAITPRESSLHGMIELLLKKNH